MSRTPFSLKTLLTILLFAGVMGCAPSISPLYRDFEDTTSGSESETSNAIDRIHTALVAAGWQVTDAHASNVVATAPRTFREWWIYRIEVELEVAPLAGDHVRVLISPYRRFFTGGRRKIPYLKKGVGRSVLRDLTTAFEQEGLIAIGTASDRDASDEEY